MPITSFNSHKSLFNLNFTWEKIEVERTFKYYAQGHTVTKIHFLLYLVNSYLSLKPYTHVPSSEKLSLTISGRVLGPSLGHPVPLSVTALINLCHSLIQQCVD